MRSPLHREVFRRLAVLAGATRRKSSSTGRSGAKGSPRSRLTLFQVLRHPPVPDLARRAFPAHAGWCEMVGGAKELKRNNENKKPFKLCTHQLRFTLLPRRRLGGFGGPEH